MKRFLLAAIIGLLIGNFAFYGVAADVKSQIGVQDLALDTDGAAHSTFQRRTSTGGVLTLDRIDGNQIPWSLDYTRTIRPKSITGDSTGSITGYSIPLYLSNYLSVYDALTAWVDVRAYGAVGDGTTDDTAAIQAAIDAAAAAKTYVVLIPEGVYSFTTLNMKSGVILRGTGWVNNRQDPFGHSDWNSNTYISGSVLRKTGSGNGIEVDASTSLISNVSIQDLAIIGPGSGTSVGVNVSGDNNVAWNNGFLSNVLVANFYEGVYLEDFISNSIYDLDIRGCTTGITFGVISNNINMSWTTIQACATAVVFVGGSQINFYGGLIQSNTLGISFAGLTTVVKFDGLWFENNTASFETTGTSASNIMFIGCRESSPWTYAPTGYFLFQVVSFINCNFSTISLDFSGLDGYMWDWTLINTIFNSVTGMSSDNMKNWNSIGPILTDDDTRMDSVSKQMYSADNVSGAYTPDYSKGSLQSYTLTDNVTIALPSNMPIGSEITFIFVQGTGGGFTVTWNSWYQYPVWSETGNTEDAQSVITFRKTSWTVLKQMTAQVPYH